jgi:PPK2 family polyphosphate:nucleotide phosphotransferase
VPDALALVHQLRVEPGSTPRLHARDPDERVGARDKKEGLTRLREHAERIGTLQARLWAEAKRTVVVVLQGMDAAGKDGTIRTVLSEVNPQGCRVISFRAPTTTELAHDYLWRVHAACPARGELGVFNRSHYEDVIAVRVCKLAPEQVWRRRYEHIRAFERLLVDEGTEIVKVFLHLSPDAQRERLQERLDDPAKRWKFRLGDLDDRKLWNDYTAAYEEAIAKTSTDWAPWYVVPADHNWSRNLAVAEILRATLERLDPHFPEPDPGLDGVVIS